MQNKEYIHLTLSNVSDAVRLINSLNNNDIEYDYKSSYPLENSRIITGNSKSIPRIALIFGIIGFIAAYFLQFWAGSIYQPQNLGNKPFFSWITSLPIAFEIGILSAGLSSFTAFIFRITAKSKNRFIESKDIQIIINKIDIRELEIICKNEQIDIKVIETDN